MSKQITSIPFHLAHLDLMDLRDIERRAIGVTKEKMAALAQIGMSVTLIYDGRIVGFGGYLMLWEGTFEVFFAPTAYVVTCPVQFIKMIRMYLKSFRETFPDARFQSAAINNQQHTRWMRMLGFQYEGVMPRYLAGVDYNMWGMVQ